MAASGKEIRDSGDSQEVAGGTFPSVASTHARPAQQVIEALKKITQEEIPVMGKEEVLAFQKHLRALKLHVLQWIKEEEEEKAAAAAAEQATAPEPRRAG